MTLLASAINSFTFSLFRKLADDEENVFFSPFSISTALSMLLCGARSHTEKEMREVLELEAVSIPSADVHSSFDQLLALFSKTSDHMTLTSANAILSQKGMPLSPEFKKTIENVYRALLMEVDFALENEKAVREVNEWVQKGTNQMIKEIVQSLDPSTVMVILNAIYFKGSWKYPFDPTCTHPKPFYNRGKKNQSKDVPMMFKDRKFKYVEKETFKALELPYENDAVTMLLLLPKEIDGLKNLEDLLSVGFLKDTMNSLDYRNVDVILPSFRIEYTKKLSGALVKLGMVSAFDSSSADFSAINDRDLCVSEVVTKAVLVVNEEGTEAAAATAVMVMLCAMVYNEKFEADHPFLCIIYDKEKDMILFIGRVLEF